MVFSRQLWQHAYWPNALADPVRQSPPLDGDIIGAVRDHARSPTSSRAFTAALATPTSARVQSRPSWAAINHSLAVQRRLGQPVRRAFGCSATLIASGALNGFLGEPSGVLGGGGGLVCGSEPGAVLFVFFGGRQLSRGRRTRCRS